MEDKHYAVEITDSNFEELVLNSDKPVLVDFWAQWCGPCRSLGPTIEEVAKDYDGKAVVGKLNVDFNPETSLKYKIRSIPAVLFFNKGEVVDRSLGNAPKETFSNKLDAILVKEEEGQEEKGE